MISSTGLYLTVHNCSSENIRELFFFNLLTEEPCEHHAGSDNENSCGHPEDNHLCPENNALCINPLNDSDSCSGTPDMPECCSNTVLFISVEDNFIKSDPSLISLTWMLQLVFAIDPVNLHSNNNDVPLITYTDPPTVLYDRGLILLNRTLLL